mgnify:CR=1 FL=1
MNIGLIDVDGHHFPNLALMRLSAYHKAHGDSVEWWDGFKHYDRVYMSKVFTFSPDVDTCINADEIITGGTGYKDYGSLPAEIEGTFPDYSLYPEWKPAIGFLTRGCIRNCPWCIVPKKEGTIRPRTRLGADRAHGARERAGGLQSGTGCAAHHDAVCQAAGGGEMDPVRSYEL